ncbi:MAG: type II secretion system F family protein [Phycisphaerales bacterium]
MMSFAYTGRDRTGQPVQGVVEAESRRDAFEHLKQEGIAALTLNAARERTDFGELEIKLAANQVGREDVIAFSSQLAVMLETGVPLVEAMEAVGESGKNQGHLGRVIGNITRRISDGEPFSEALSSFPKLFPTLMISLVRAAEASGTLGPMLERVARYLDKDRKTIRQIQGALTYPLIMVGLSMVITGFLVTWVLPRFAKIYESREAALPKPTKIVLSISDFLQSHWVPLVGSIIVLVVAFLVARGTAGGRRLLDTVKLRLPVVGPMLNSFYLARSVRTLGTLLASGVPLLDAVAITRGVTSNHKWNELWDRTEAAMTAGQPVSDVLCSSTLIPPTVARMIKAGEKTGQLPGVLERVADTVEDDLDNAIKNATQLIEPAMIIFMGATIGGIAIALLLPVFSISSTVSS